MRKKQKNEFVVPVLFALSLLVTLVTYLVFRMGQKSIEIEKWKDYDNYGWS